MFLLTNIGIFVLIFSQKGLEKLDSF